MEGEDSRCEEADGKMYAGKVALQVGKPSFLDNREGSSLM